MKRIPFVPVVAIFVLCLSTAALVAQEVPPQSHPESQEWTPLFAADLSNASYPAGVWTFEDGVLTASKDECIWTKAEYDDFVLDLEFKTASGTNSGVIVHCSDVENWIPNAIEIQIADDYAEKWATSPPSWQCGAVFGRQPATKRTVKKPDEWNRLSITCQGPMIYVMLNGALVNEMDMRTYTDSKKNPDGTVPPPWIQGKPLAEWETKGHIGLQGKHAGAPIFFRNLKIKPIETQQ